MTVKEAGEICDDFDSKYSKKGRPTSCRHSQ